MCEYCGCQALTAIDELTREHDMVVDLIGDARAAHATGDATRLGELSRQIAAVLGPHTEVEERGLFLALAADFPGQVAALAVEHRRIDAVLGEAAAGTPTDPTWPARLVEVLVLLRGHILKEQDGVFPAALTTLRAADWEAIDAVRARVRLRPGASRTTPDASRTPDRAAATEDRLKVT